MTVKRIEMALHIMGLCAEHSVTVKFTPHETGDYRASRVSRTIWTRPIKQTGFYISALHELGHVLSPGQGTRANRLAEEWDAWRWAKQQAIVWTPQADRVMLKAFGSYVAADIRRNIDNAIKEFPAIAAYLRDNQCGPRNMVEQRLLDEGQTLPPIWGYVPDTIPECSEMGTVGVE